MNSGIRLAFLLLVGLTFSAPTISDSSSKYTIAAAELSGLFSSTDRDGNLLSHGAYFQLLQQILKETGMDVRYNIDIMPMRRAKLEFSRQNAACYAPGLDTFDQHERDLLPSNLIYSEPVNRALVRVLSREGSKVISAAEDIAKTDSISVVRGVPISAEMAQMMQRAKQSVFVDSELENLKLLGSGRIDFVLAFYPDIIFAYRHISIDKPYPFDPAYSPLEIIDNIVCHEKHTDLITLINSKLQQYLADGKLQLILGDYYLPAISTSPLAHDEAALGKTGH